MQTPTAVPVPPQQANKLNLQKVKELVFLASEKLKADPKMKRVLIFAAVALAAIFVLLVVGTIAKSLMGGKKVQKVAPSPSPSASQSAQPEILNPSRYATDSAVLSIEDTLKSINQDAGSLDVREYSLRPPTLDFDINF